MEQLNKFVDDLFALFNKIVDAIFALIEKIGAKTEDAEETTTAA